MDAIELLTRDHDTARDLFEQFRSAEEAEDEARMREVQRRIFDELDTHTRIEEEVFYPALREAEFEDIEDLVAEGVQEHHVVKVLMREVDELTTMDVFAAKMTVLIENVEHHADEEEDEMFPKVRKHFSQQELDDLGDRLEAAKQAG